MFKNTSKELVNMFIKYIINIPIIPCISNNKPVIFIYYYLWLTSRS